MEGFFVSFQSLSGNFQSLSGKIQSVIIFLTVTVKIISNPMLEVSLGGWKEHKKPSNIRRFRNTIFRNLSSTPEKIFSFDTDLMGKFVYLENFPFKIGSQKLKCKITGICFISILWIILGNFQAAF